MKFFIKFLFFYNFIILHSRRLKNRSNFLDKNPSTHLTNNQLNISNVFYRIANFSFCDINHNNSDELCPNLKKDFHLISNNSLTQNNIKYEIFKSDQQKKIVIKLNGGKINFKLGKDTLDKFNFFDSHKLKVNTAHLIKFYQKEIFLIKGELLELQLYFPEYNYIFTGHILGDVMSNIFSIESYFISSILDVIKNKKLTKSPINSVKNYSISNISSDKIYSICEKSFNSEYSEVYSMFKDNLYNGTFYFKEECRKIIKFYKSCKDTENFFDSDNEKCFDPKNYFYIRSQIEELKKLEKDYINQESLIKKKNYTDLIHFVNSEKEKALIIKTKSNKIKFLLKTLNGVWKNFLSKFKGISNKITSDYILIFSDFKNNMNNLKEFSSKISNIKELILFSKDNLNQVYNYLLPILEKIENFLNNSLTNLKKFNEILTPTNSSMLRKIELQKFSISEIETDLIQRNFYKIYFNLKNFFKFSINGLKRIIGCLNKKENQLYKNLQKLNIIGDSSNVTKKFGLKRILKESDI